MATPSYGLPALALTLVTIGVSAVLYASGAVTNLGLLGAFIITVLGAWTLVYGFAYKMDEKGYYGGWGIFLILLAASVTVYSIVANVLYSVALLAIGLGTLILLAVLRRGGESRR